MLAGRSSCCSVHPVSQVSSQLEDSPFSREPLVADTGLHCVWEPWFPVARLVPTSVTVSKSCKLLISGVASSRECTEKRSAGLPRGFLQI